MLILKTVEIERLAGAIMFAMVEATVELHERGVAGEFPERVRQMRELYSWLLAELVGLDASLEESLREITEAIGHNLVRLESEIERPIRLH